VGPFDLSVVLRQYMGHFMAHCQHSFATGEIALGLNPDSEDWTLLFQHLTEVGWDFICGDFKSYDASLATQIAAVVVIVINDFYDDSEENKRIRETLIYTIFNSTHMMDNLVFELKQGNCSGNALTTFINCLFNMFFMRYVYFCKVSKDLTLFNYYIRLKVLGDDNLSNVAKDIRELFNMVTIEEVLKPIGVTYTSASKEKIEQKKILSV